MTKKDLISVIIPIYNIEKYLRRCINSVINQSYGNLEIILVDDGSTDNSGKICDEYALKDSRIKVIHKENRGVASARNAGLDIAQGKYIGFVDGDDYILLDMYEFLYALLIENNVEVSCCNRFEFIGNGYSTSSDFPKNGIFSVDEILEDRGWGFSIWDKLFSKSLIENIRFDENVFIGEDLLFCFNVLKRSKKICYCNSAKYVYYTNVDSIMRKKTFRKEFLEVIRVHDYIIEYARKNRLMIAYKRFTKYKLLWMVDFLSRIANHNCIDNNKESVDYLIKKIKENMLSYLFGDFKFLMKCFILVCCINFNFASQIYRLVYKKKIWS